MEVAECFAVVAGRCWALGPRDEVVVVAAAGVVGVGDGVVVVGVEGVSVRCAGVTVVVGIAGDGFDIGSGSDLEV